MNTTDATDTVDQTGSENSQLVDHFRQVLLWPVQLLCLQHGGDSADHWRLMPAHCAENPWSPVIDEFTEDPTRFQERHYREFVSFLPHVQRFLYGRKCSGAERQDKDISPIKVFRREDVKSVRLTLPDFQVVTLEVKHVDLYFFYDIDVAILVVEVFGSMLTLECTQEIVCRFGRAFPTGWDTNGEPSHCMRNVEWLGAAGNVLASSNFSDRTKFLNYTGSNRSASIGAHWEFLLRPMVQNDSDQEGALRYSQLEYHRMPKLTFIAMADPTILSRQDYLRLALGLGAGDDRAAGASLGYSEAATCQMEQAYYYDRYWGIDMRSQPAPTRVTCNGHSMVMLCSSRNAWQMNEDSGLLSQFRHQFFIVALIAHFHKAALLQMSNRLVDAISALNIKDSVSKQDFKIEIRECLEAFLRFNHRYWFHEVSIQPMMQDLYALFGHHLGNTKSFEELRTEILDMGQYLDSDDARRQGESVLRLTVVTIFGLVGTIVTGFLGMNLLAEADNPFIVKVGYFFIVLIPTMLLTAFTVNQSSTLSALLDVIGEKGLSWKQRWSKIMSLNASRRR